MIRKDELLHQVNVQRPCPANWDAMDGDASKRYCGQCRHHVHNLSEMTAAEAEALLANRTERLCVRYVKDSLGNVITRDRRPRRLGLWARLAFAVSAALSLFGFQQPPAKPAEQGDVAVPKRSGKMQQILGKNAIPRQVQGTPVPTTGIVAPTGPDGKPWKPPAPPKVEKKIVKKKVKKVAKPKPVVKAKPVASKPKPPAKP